MENGNKDKQEIKKPDLSNFKFREFEEVEGGYYEEGFYYTPNGSKSKFL